MGATNGAKTMTPTEVAAFLGVRPKTLANHRYLGDGWPAYRKIGPEPPAGRQDKRRVVYDADEVRRFRENGRMERTVAR